MTQELQCEGSGAPLLKTDLQAVPVPVLASAIKVVAASADPVPSCRISWRNGTLWLCCSRMYCTWLRRGQHQQACSLHKLLDSKPPFAPRDTNCPPGTAQSLDSVPSLSLLSRAARRAAPAGSRASRAASPICVAERSSFSCVAGLQRRWHQETATGVLRPWG